MLGLQRVTTAARCVCWQGVYGCYLRELQPTELLITLQAAAGERGTC